MCIKSNFNNNSSDDNDNDNTNNNRKKLQLLKAWKKGNQRYWLKLNKPFLKQMITIRQPPSSLLSRYPVLNPQKKQWYKCKVPHEMETENKK